MKEEPEKEDLSDDQENSDIDVDHHETSTEVFKPTTENYGNMGCQVSNLLIFSSKLNINYQDTIVFSLIFSYDSMNSF